MLMSVKKSTLPQISPISFPEDIKYQRRKYIICTLLIGH